MKVCFINPPFKAEYGKFSRESRSPSIVLPKRMVSMWLSLMRLLSR